MDNISLLKEVWNCEEDFHKFFPDFNSFLEWANTSGVLFDKLSINETPLEIGKTQGFLYVLSILMNKI